MLTKPIPSPFVRKSAQDWVHSQGPRGGSKWTNTKTGEVVYGPSNPGGEATGTPQQPPGELQPQQQAQQPSMATEKAQGYADQLKAKFGEQAAQRVAEMKAKVAGDPVKVAALEQVEKLLAPQKPLTSAFLESEKRAEKPKPKASPQYGLHAHESVPDRHIRYEAGKPVKIHDAKPGTKHTQESYITTDERPGVVRDKEGGVLSLQVDKPEKGDVTNSVGMHHRVRGDFDGITIAVQKQYDKYLYDLGQQAEALLDGNWPDKDDFSQEAGQEAATELRGHIEQAQSEIQEWYEEAWRSKFGASSLDEHRELLQEVVAESFQDVRAALDAMNDAEDADSFRDASSDLSNAIGDAMSHVDDGVTKMHDARQQEIGDAEAAEEAERDETVDDLNAAEDFEEAKKIAQKYNREAAKNDAPYRVSFDKDSGEWFYEEKSLSKAIPTPFR